MISLTAFTAGLLLIILSELGDKSFFITAILATRHPRRWVLTGATAALVAMTILSVSIGQIVTAFPQVYVTGVAVALLIGSGFKLLYDAVRTCRQKKSIHEHSDALEVVEHREQGTTIRSRLGIWLEAFSLTFIAEWGDRTQVATIALAASHHPLGVILGATLGHSICTAIAVVCGPLIAGCISERWISIVGGTLFVAFGIITAIEIA